MDGKKMDGYDFEYLWTLEGTLVEEGNIKEKSGHSHVVRTTLSVAGVPRLVYIKKQTNYATTLSRLLHRTSSLCRREYANIMAWHKMGLPTMDAVYCGEVKNPLRGILVTMALEGYQPLDDYLNAAPSEARHSVLQQTAVMIRRVHDAGWVHRCFFPKHVFVSHDHVAAPVKMIDLEKARKAWLGLRDYTRDLGSFERRIAWQSDAERQSFFDAYFGGSSMTLYRQLFMYLIGQRIAQKKSRGVSDANRCA